MRSTTVHVLHGGYGSGAACIVLVAVLSVCVSAAPTTRVEAQGETNNPTSYQIAVTFLDFRDSDQSANISIYLSAQFPMVSGPPGRYGLDITDRDTGSYAHEETNGTCANQACSAANWYFNFFVRFRGRGAGDFYPYDSWMFNITLETPLMFSAKNTNTEIHVASYAYGWEIKGTPATRLVEGPWGSDVITVVLQRAGWTVFPIRFVPIVLFLILGLTALIPAKDLSSKTTVITAVIFFILAFVLNLGPILPRRFYGLSFAEFVFYYLLLLASAYLGESILENRIFAQKRGGKSETGLVIMQVFMVLLAFGLIFSYTSSFGSLTSTYWWSGPDIFETRYYPVAAVAAGTLLNVLLIKLRRGA